MSPKVNIIGAGLAGLSTGIHLRQLGIDTEIFELAPWAGGMCTTWVRSGYRFDGCIHWMVGTRKGDPIYNLYREVDALNDSVKIYNAGTIQLELNGVMYDIPLEIEKFKALLLKLGRDDEDAVLSFVKDIKTMMRSKLPLGAPTNLREAVQFLFKSWGFLSLVRKHGNKTVGEYLKEIKSDTLRQLLLHLMPSEFSAIGIIMMLGTRMSGNAGYPMGGALEVTQRMVDKYTALGGKINYNARVDQIVVENEAVKGVRVKGKLYPADYVVAACDAYDTLKNMLGDKYAHPQLDTLLKEAPLFDPLAIVSFGLNKRFDIPFAVTYDIPEGINIAPGVKDHSFSLRSFDFDEKAAPVGCSSVMVMMGAPVDYWQNLRETDLEAYKKQKQLLADAVAEAVEKRIPGFKDAIRVTDVSTPATYVRLTNVYKGSYEGFAPLPAAMKKTIQKNIPGLKNLYLCGQWTTAGGGICTAVNDGKTVARKIAKELK